RLLQGAVVGRIVEPAGVGSGVGGKVAPQVVVPVLRVVVVELPAVARHHVFPGQPVGDELRGIATRVEADLDPEVGLPGVLQVGGDRVVQTAGVVRILQVGGQLSARV